MPGSAHRSVSFNLAGWLWADLLLGMFAIFLAANALAPSSEAAKPAGIDPTPIVMRIEVSGFALLGSDAALSNAEQQRIAAEIRDQLAAQAPGRHAAIVFAPRAAARSAARRRAETPRPLEATGGRARGDARVDLPRARTRRRSRRQARRRRERRRARHHATPAAGAREPRPQRRDDRARGRR